jgi:hypothetical protein
MADITNKFPENVPGTVAPVNQRQIFAKGRRVAASRKSYSGFKDERPIGERGCYGQ